MSNIIIRLKEKRHYFWILFLLLAFVFLLKNSFSYLDPDLGWHLRMGQEILTLKQVPKIEHIDYTVQGKNWVDHEWLMNLTTYWLYKYLGYPAVNVFFDLIIIFSLIILLNTVYKFFSTKTKWLPAAFLFLGVMAMSGHLGVRMQEITILNLIVLLFVLYHYDKYKKIGILFILPTLFYFWANAHAGFLIGLFVLFLWIGIKIIEKILYKFKKYFIFISFNRISSLRHINLALVFILGSFIITLLTPYKFDLYKFLSTYTDAYYLTHIDEWLPIYSLPLEPWRFVYVAIFFVVLIIEVLAAIKVSKNKGVTTANNERKINLWPNLLAVVFLFLAVKSKRNFPLFFAASFPLIVDVLAAFLYLEPDWLKKRSGNYVKLVHFYTASVTICLIILLFFSLNYVGDPFNGFCKFYPCAAVNFIKNNSNLNNLKMFNNYDWGGFLVWVWPGKPLFIDGRLPQFKYAGRTLLEEHNEFYKTEKAKAKLEQYGIELVFDKKKSVYKPNWLEKYFIADEQINILDSKSLLQQYLESSKQWLKIYEDDLSLIYLREDKSSREMFRKI